MSQQMKQVILELLEKHGLKDAFERAAGGEFHARFDNNGYLPLVVEKIAGDEVSVAHYGKQNGDAMRDPEMTFRLRGNAWQAATFENSYTGAYQQVYHVVQGVERFRPALQRELTSFATLWAKNIRDQGWLEDRVKVSSLTHQWILDHAHPPQPLAPDEHLEQYYEDRNGCGCE